MNNIIKYIEFLGFNIESKLGTTVITYIKIINDGTACYGIVLNKNLRTIKLICNDMIIYEASLNLYPEEVVMYSLVHSLELGEYSIMKEKDLITNRKCIDKLIEYENNSKDIALVYNEKLEFLIIDKNILVTVEGKIPVHAIAIDLNVKDIIERYHYNKQEEIKESRVKFIKTVLDGYVDRYEIIKNFITELENLGFVFKIDKDFKYYSYRDMIHVRIKGDHVRLYLNQFNKYKRFEITDTTLNDICDYIKNI